MLRHTEYAYYFRADGYGTRSMPITLMQVLRHTEYAYYFKADGYGIRSMPTTLGRLEAAPQENYSAQQPCYSESPCRAPSWCQQGQPVPSPA